MCVGAIRDFLTHHMARIAIVAVVHLLYVAISANSVIQGPFPLRAVVPVNSYVGFTCEVNTSDLTTGNYSGFGWTIWPPATSGSSGIAGRGTNGSLIYQTSMRIKVTEIYLSGGIVQCIVTLMPNYVKIFSTNATVLAYGECTHVIK